MKLILLNGHGIDMRVSNAKLHIKDGRFSANEEPEQYVFSPKRIDIDSIVVYGQSGNLSIDAIRWLIKHNVQISIMDWNGKLLTTMLPPESTNVKTKFAQYHAYEDQETRLKLAKSFIEAKFDKTQIVLDYLHQRYPDIDNDFSKHSSKLPDVSNIREILGVEGAVAVYYWGQFEKFIPEKYEFDDRTGRYKTRPYGAGDMVNCMLNYGYSLLEAECMRTINAVGMDVHVGFLHEMATGKNSLAYDMQEPFRFLVDLAVINLIETDRMEKKDFIRTDNYSLRLRPSGAKKLTEEFQTWMNKRTTYQDKSMMWSYVLLLKTRELAQFLNGKKRKIDFVNPCYTIERQDTDEIRKKILNISYSEWKDMGFSKGTLHYMKKNAKGDKPFTLNAHVRERLEMWGEV
ncbi:CRISPR-associated endonuclease Cas1 [Methanolobus sp. WCC5]|uniref:CRISPR-associated endonuclease Cas1 n=1 Tax=Methanolobus sp. WCC5 TaxID=3125785 RepID=UPI0032544F66